MSNSMMFPDRHCISRTKTWTTFLDGDAVKTAESAVSFCDKLRVSACETSRNSRVYIDEVHAVLDVMQRFADLSVQRSGLLALAAFSEKQMLSQTIGEAHGVEVLVRAWGMYATDDVLVKNALVTMRSLSGAEMNRETFFCEDGLHLVMQAMRAFAERESIVNNALALLANLSFEHDDRRRKMIEEGVVQLVVKAFRQFECSRRLGGNACLALRNISMDEIACQQLVGNGVGVIVDCVKRGRDRPQVTEEALGVLLNVANALKDGNSDEVAQAVEQYLRVTKDEIGNTRYEQSHELSFAVLSALYKRSEKAPKELLNVGVEYARKYVGISVAVVAHVCLFLRCASRCRDNRETLVGQAETLVILLKCVSYLQSLYVEHALVALGNAVFDSTTGKAVVCKNGGIELVNDVMNRFGYMAATAEACLLCIHAICQDNNDNGKRASEEGLHTTCVNVMNRFASNLAIQERALAALVSMGGSSVAIEGLKRSEAMEMAHKAAMLFPLSRTVRAQVQRLEQMLNIKQNEKRLSLSKFVRHMSRT